MLRFRFYFFFILILFTRIFDTCSQEKYIYTNSYLDPFIINPACTGLEYYAVAHLSYEKQWLNFPDSPSTYKLTWNSKLGNFNFYDSKGMVNKGPLKLKERVGIGAGIYKDNNGLLSTTGGLLSYAYHIPFKDKNNLSFGMSLLLNNYSLRSSLLDPDQSNDSYLFSGNDNVFNINFATGIFYREKHYFAGISMTNILPDISGISETKKTEPGYFLITGYQFGKNRNQFYYEPSVELKYISSEDIFVDLHAKVYYKQLNWGALSISSSKRVNIQFALNIYKRIYFAYSYGFTFSQIESLNGDLHQISIGINLGLINVDGIRKTSSQ